MEALCDMKYLQRKKRSDELKNEDNIKMGNQKENIKP